MPAASPLVLIVEDHLLVGLVMKNAVERMGLRTAGWTGGADTLSQVELSFPSRESAIAYAERQGLVYRVENGFERRPRGPNRELPEVQSEFETALASLVWLSWMQAKFGRCDQYATPEIERALTDPASACGADEAVVHPELSRAAKREARCQSESWSCGVAGTCLSAGVLTM